VSHQAARQSFRLREVAMSRAACPKLQVSSAGARSFIYVPTGWSADLHAYLRGNQVRCDPPDPSSTGTDVIELARRADVAAIQELLDNWA